MLELHSIGCRVAIAEVFAGIDISRQTGGRHCYRTEEGNVSAVFFREQSAFLVVPRGSEGSLAAGDCSSQRS